METKTQEIIKNQFESLPKDLQQAILNTDIGGIVNTISKKHLLHIDQEGLLQTEVLLVLLGLEDVDRFVDNVTKNGIADQENAHIIAEEIHNQIFLPVIENLQKIQEEYRALGNNKDENLLGGHTSEASARKELLEAIESPFGQTKNNFVNAFLTKPVSTTQTTTAITVGGVGGEPKQAGTGTAGLSPLSAPASMQSSLNSVTTPSNTNQKPIVAPKTYTVDPYKEPLN